MLWQNGNTSKTLYICDCCGRILHNSEVNITWDDTLDEIYVNCKYCGGECMDYKEEEDDKDDD